MNDQSAKEILDIIVDMLFEAAMQVVV